MAVRTRRIFGPFALVTGVNNLYTVPAGRTLIIREFRVYNSAAGTVAATLNVVNSPEGVTGVIHRWSVATLTAVREDCYTVLNPGDQLKASPNVAGLAVTAFGSLLEGAPS